MNKILGILLFFSVPTYAVQPVDPEVQKRMLSISEQLGITCDHCHDVKNFKDRSKPTFGKALKHIELVEILNKDHKERLGFKIDCYTCHKAIPKPKFQLESDNSKP